MKSVGEIASEMCLVFNPKLGIFELEIWPVVMFYPLLGHLTSTLTYDIDLWSKFWSLNVQYWVIPCYQRLSLSVK